MNTELIYVSNIPSSIKPVLLLHELENKWSRMLYLENSFSGFRDAFIYNPTPSGSHFCKGVERLKEKAFEDNKRLGVHYVWFPPPNVFLTVMIPDGASMLNYIFVENLPKSGNPSLLTSDLPFQQHDIKVWDVAERQDKCMVIKLPPSTNPAMRSYVLATLRSRNVLGVYPNVYEIIISDNPELSQVMVPKTIQNAESSESFMANFLFMHSIPSKLTVKTLVDSTKTDNIKGCRIFFLEVMQKTKLGFVYVPKSLPFNKFESLGEKMRTTEYITDDGTKCHIKLNEVWFQPLDADPPRLTAEEAAMTPSPPEYVLTQYIYLHNIPPNVISAQLLMGSPCAVKLYVFPVNDLSTQIGFVVLRGLTPDSCQVVIDHFRNLTIGGFPILVNEVYLKCFNLPHDNAFRDPEFIPRTGCRNSSEISKKRGMMTTQLSPYENGGNSAAAVESCRKHFSNIILSHPPPDWCQLMKSEFICVSNISPAVSYSALVFDLGITVNGCLFITTSQNQRFAFIYLAGCDVITWKKVITKLASKSFQGKTPLIQEVYVQPSESLMDCKLEGYQRSPFVFIYNIPVGTDNLDDVIKHDMISSLVCMDTDSGSRCVIASIYQNCTETQMDDCLIYLRQMKVNGKPIFAENLWLADIYLENGQPPEKKAK